MKLWIKHWVSLHTRPFTYRGESPVLLVSIEKDSLGEGQLPVVTKPEFRHYMSNVFMYLMPQSEDGNLACVIPEDLPKKGLVHNWELKFGMSLGEAKEFVKELLKVIALCEKRREERHKQIREE